MSLSSKTTTIATGLAMFSMFFGAGNIVFPLALGQIAQDKHFFALAGMLITAVIVPFIGLIAMLLFDGDYEEFFGRLGKVPGFILILIILGLIGPFGAIPRCIALSYSTVKALLPGLSLPLFSTLSCAIIWLFTFKRNTIIETLGYVLTPLLLASLAIIIIKGFMDSSSQTPTEQHPFHLFVKGLKDGYQTMDLLGAFFFSSVVIVGLKAAAKGKNAKGENILSIALKASVIGAVLLSLVYIGFSFVASFHGQSIGLMPPDELISTIALHLLGPYAAAVACIAVALACLTTAIALSAVFAEFIHTDIAHDRINYNFSLCLTLIIAFFVSTLQFSGIAAFLLPILQIAYPALITLAVLNILYKLYGFQPVKIPVLLVLLVSAIVYFF